MSRDFRIRKALGSPGELALESIPLSGASPTTLAILQPDELEDLFWTLARHLSRTVDDDQEAAS